MTKHPATIPGVQADSSVAPPLTSGDARETVGGGGRLASCWWVDVALLCFDGCPHWRVTDARLREALVEVGCADVPVEHRTVSTPAEGDAATFRGSPTVLVNGQDPFFGQESPVGLSCRVYRTEDGLAGAPTVRQLIGVLREPRPSQHH